MLFNSSVVNAIAQQELKEFKRRRDKENQPPPIPLALTKKEGLNPPQCQASTDGLGRGLAEPKLKKRNLKQQFKT